MFLIALLQVRRLSLCPSFEQLKKGKSRCRSSFKRIVAISHKLFMRGQGLKWNSRLGFNDHFRELAERAQARKYDLFLHLWVKYHDLIMWYREDYLLHITTAQFSAVLRSSNSITRIYSRRKFGWNVHEDENELERSKSESEKKRIPLFRNWAPQQYQQDPEVRMLTCWKCYKAIIASFPKGLNCCWAAGFSHYRRLHTTFHSWSQNVAFKLNGFSKCKKGRIYKLQPGPAVKLTFRRRQQKLSTRNIASRIFLKPRDWWWDLMYSPLSLTKSCLIHLL